MAILSLRFVISVFVIKACITYYFYMKQLMLKKKKWFSTKRSFSHKFSNLNFYLFKIRRDIVSCSCFCFYFSADTEF